MWMYGNGFWMIFGWIWILLFTGGLIALVIWGIKKLTERGNSITKRDPLDIAKERYAKGEISREEFERLKKDLS